jgi:hypothetical protein
MNVVALNVVALNVVALNVVALNVVALNVVALSVVIPAKAGIHGRRLNELYQVCRCRLPPEKTGDRSFIRRKRRLRT